MAYREALGMAVYAHRLLQKSAHEKRLRMLNISQAIAATSRRNRGAAARMLRQL